VRRLGYGFLHLFNLPERTVKINASFSFTLRLVNETISLKRVVGGNIMKTFLEDHESHSWSVLHPFATEDHPAMAATRTALGPLKGKLQGTAARIPFDAIMGHVAAPIEVSYATDQIGGIQGWWCRPENARPGQAVLHLHGGWFNWGSAQAYRNFAGHIAAQTHTAVFVPDYRLAPEYPFPAAAEDVQACYLGLTQRGFSKIAITGDSAGGNLALGLLVHLAANPDTASKALVAGVALSPVTDLTLTGNSWSTRAAADPVFTQPQVTELVGSYLHGHDPADPFASPLFADLKGLAPTCVLVGDDEVLLDDSFRFVERAVAAGVDARLDVWEGMIHGFVGSVGHLEASNQALQIIGEFLSYRFAD
jgi:monoterpene epsilon-lactone hydrolase